MKSIYLSRLLILVALFIPLNASAQTWIKLQDSEQIENYSGTTFDEMDVSSIVERGGFAYVNFRRYESSNRDYHSETGTGVSIHCRNKSIEWAGMTFDRKNRKEWWSKEHLAEGSRVHVQSSRAQYIKDMPSHLKTLNRMNANRDKRLNAWYGFICER